MKKLTLKQAKSLSIKKWKIIVKEGSDDSIYDHSSFKGLRNRCGLCQFYIPNPKDICGDCPLAQKRLYCCPEFFRWYDTHSLEAAQAVLDRIKAIEI